MSARDPILDHWEAQAAKHGASHEASWGDSHAIALELNAISEHLRDGDTVLDAGCGNGHAAFCQLLRRKLTLTGVDFSSAMIDAALKAKGERAAQFKVGDIRALDFPDDSFDVVYTTRALINLPTWAEQAQAIRECLRVARRKVIFSEGFWEPMCTLNAMRALVGLPALVEHDFNRYLKKSKVEAMLRELGLRFTVDEFSGVYYLGSRFLREIATDAAAWPGYSNPLNRIFCELEREYSCNGLGIQQAYVVGKTEAQS